LLLIKSGLDVMQITLKKCNHFVHPFSAKHYDAPLTLLLPDKKHGNQSRKNRLNTIYLTALIDTPRNFDEDGHFSTATD